MGVASAWTVTALSRWLGGCSIVLFLFFSFSIFFFLTSSLIKILGKKGNISSLDSTETVWTTLETRASKDQNPFTLRLS